MDIVRHNITETINSRDYGHAFLKIARLFKIYVQFTAKHIIINLGLTNMLVSSENRIISRTK